MSININSNPGVHATGINLSGLDLETALLAVQSERVRLLDEQLYAQIDEVKARNDQVAKLHTLQTALNKAKEHFKSDDKATKKFRDVKINDKQAKHSGSKHQGIVNDINAALKEAGFSKPINLDITKGELETMIQDAKNAVDRESNSQQMDMLRLQSLSGKRNEAFDVMTNFVKKMQDSRSSIIGNLR